MGTGAVGRVTADVGTLVIPCETDDLSEEVSPLVEFSWKIAGYTVGKAALEDDEGTEEER